MPPMVQPSRLTTAVFATLSVVMIASAATSPPSVELGDGLLCAARTLPRKTSSPTPMRPVEQTSTSPALTPRSSAAFSAV